MEWQQKRKLAYVLGGVGVLVLILAYPVYKLANPVPTCFDKKQNGAEVGVDCGGGCNLFCSSQITPLRVVWAKAFPEAKGFYDMGAYVENPNALAGIRALRYTMQMLGGAGAVLGESRGTVEVPPSGAIILFAPNIPSTEVPDRVVVSFDETDLTKWVKARAGKTMLTVKNQTLRNTDAKPRLDAILVNNDETNDVGYVDLSALIFDGKRNPVAISRTYSDGVARGSEQNVYFTWQNRFTKNPRGGMCTTPVDTMLVFDRSGSMNEGNKTPPEPLTAAKSAAMSYANLAELKDKVGFVSFASTPTNPIDRELTNDMESLKSVIAGVEILKDGLQYTNLGDAIKLATAELLSTRHTEGAKRVIVALTDGVANRPLDPKNPLDQKYPEEYASGLAREAQRVGIEVYAIGLGDSFNEAFLRDKIATNKDHYFKATNVLDLQGIYKKIGETVCAEESFIKEIVITPRAIFEK